MTLEASGSGGRSSQARVTTSCSWSDDRNTDTALVVDVLNKVELQQDNDRVKTKFICKQIIKQGSTVINNAESNTRELQNLRKDQPNSLTA